MPPLGPRLRVVKPIKVRAVKAKGNPVPRKQGQSLTQAPAIRVPKPRGHAPTVFDQPIGAVSPTKRMVVKQQRKTARAVLDITGGAPSRPLKPVEVKRTLQSPAARQLLKAARQVAPIPTLKQHKSFPQKVEGVPGKAVHALEEYGKSGLARQSGQIPQSKGQQLTTSGLSGSLALSDAASKVLQAAGRATNTGAPPQSKFGHNVAKDVVEIPANTLQSFYLTATDPKGVAKSTLEQFEHPVRSFEEHPVNTLLVARGLEGGLSRAAGDALRAAPPGSALNEYAHTERPDLALTGNATVQRRYSKGIVENRVQKAVDRRAVKQGRAKVVRGRPAIQATEKEMFQPGLGRPLAGHLNRRLDNDIGIRAGLKRLRRTQALEGMLHARSVFDQIKGTQETGSQAIRRVGMENAVPLVMEGTLRQGMFTHPEVHGSVAEALLRERKALTAERTRLRTDGNQHDLNLNALSIKHLDHLMNDPEFLRDPKAAFDAARDYVKVHGNSITSGGFESDRIIHGDFTKEAAIRRVLLPFAERELGLRWVESAKRFEGSGGETVSSGAILRAFEEAGGNAEHLGYVHRFRTLDNPKSYRGGGSMLQRGGQSQRYTGTGTKGALYHRSYDALAEQMAHAAARVEHHRGVDELVSDYGHLKPGGGYWSQNEAASEIEHLKATGQGDYVARVVGRQDVPQSLLDETDPAELEHSLHKPTDTKQHVVLFRREVVKRINDHENLRDKVTPEIQTATQYFRHATLPTSPRWLAGNGVESLLRAAFNDPTLARSMVRGKKLERAIAELGPEGIRQLEKLQVGASAGIFTSQRFNDFYRPDPGEFMQRIHSFRQKPGARQVGDAWDVYKRAVFAGNQRLESTVYWSALGKELQADVQSTLGSWHQTISLAKAAYEDAANGLFDSNAVHRYINAVDRTRGRYSNLSPRGRKYVSTYTPFAPWYGNALRFIYLTLPASHPVFTGTAAALVQGTEDKRKAMGLTPWQLGQIAGRDVNHYTPFGIFSGGIENALGAGQGLVLPQFSSILLAIGGHDWTLKPFPAGTNRVGAVLNTALETFTPFLSRARVVREKGGTSVPGSTVVRPVTKVGTSTTLGAGFDKAFDPLHTSRQSPTGVGKYQQLKSELAAPSKYQKLKQELSK